MARGQVADYDLGDGHFVDIDNDNVVRSRLGNFVDRSDVFRSGGQVFGLRGIDSPAGARDVWDSEKDKFGNSGITREDVVSDSEAW